MPALAGGDEGEDGGAAEAEGAVINDKGSHGRPPMRGEHEGDLRASADAAGWAISVR